MIPRFWSAPGCARAAAVATLAALLAFSGAAAPTPLLPGALRPATVLAAISSGYVSEGRAPVAPGVQHDWGTIQTTRSGRQAVHLLEADLGRSHVVPAWPVRHVVEGSALGVAPELREMAYRRCRTGVASAP